NGNPGPSNTVARRAINELVEFSGATKVSKFIKFFILQQIDEARRFVNRQRDEAQTARNVLAKINAMIAEMEAMADQDEVYDSLMCLRDDKRAENNKLMVLNEVIVEALEDIVVKESHLEIMDEAVNDIYRRWWGFRKKYRLSLGMVKIDDPNITMEECIRLKEEKARRRVIVFNDALASEVALSCEPTVSPLNENQIDFRISFDESDDEDHTEPSEDDDGGVFSGI
nr:hypothetical protein [Tanacetum cinerariifolium]